MSTGTTSNCPSSPGELTSTRSHCTQAELERERETHKERVVALEQHIVKAEDEKHCLRVENKSLLCKLQRSKDHYEEHDAKRQTFLEQKRAEMKALKKELKNAVDMQRDTQTLLLTQLEEHRALQQQQRTQKDALDSEQVKADCLRDTVGKLHEAQVIFFKKTECLTDTLRKQHVAHGGKKEKKKSGGGKLIVCAIRGRGAHMPCVGG